MEKGRIGVDDVRKTCASVIGIIGAIIIIISGASITGNIILTNLSETTTGLTGILMILASIVLFNAKTS